MDSRCLRLALAATLFGCAPTVASTGNVCITTSDCGDGERCADQLCVPDGTGMGDAGGGGGVDGGLGGGDDGGTTTPPDGVELCGNGIDDDGDGQVDQQCACEAGGSQACYGGDEAAAGVGACAMGSQACEPSGEFGSWGACEGWVPPAAEACDGIDNDCDGTADEGCGCTTGETRRCYTGPAGTDGVGLCGPGSQECTAGAWGACVGSTLPSTDVCDGLDNDCDGPADEGCGCSLGASRSCYETPSGAPGTGTPGVGVCMNGSSVCTASPGGGSTWGACGGATTATAEICDTGADEDCDGLVDEGCGTPTVDCSVADVLFLIDTTGSMSGEIAQIRSRLTSTIIPGIATEIADVRFAVAHYDDFPTGGYGSAGDVAFRMVQTSTASAAATQAAVNTLSAAGGGDGPESTTEALYQSATGAGVPMYVNNMSCPSGVGAPCFRPGSQPIILLFTDADFHNGPGGANPYSGIAGAHTYAQTVAALNGINAKVLGLMSGAGARAHLEAIARDTGALASDGSPIVFDIGADGSSLSTDVVLAIQSLCR